MEHYQQHANDKVAVRINAAKVKERQINLCVM